MSTLKVDTIQHSGGTTGLTIDSSGRVSIPQVPAWRIGRSSNLDVDSGDVAVVTWNLDNSVSDRMFLQNVTHNSGTGKVTLPIAGIYIISANIRFDGAGAASYVNARIAINDEEDSGSQTFAYGIDGETPDTYVSINLSETYNLAANDTVKIAVRASGDSDWYIQARSSWSGHFVG